MRWNRIKSVLTSQLAAPLAAAALASLPSLAFGQHSLGPVTTVQPGLMQSQVEMGPSSVSGFAPSSAGPEAFAHGTPSLSSSIGNGTYSGYAQQPVVVNPPSTTSVLAAPVSSAAVPAGYGRNGLQRKGTWSLSAELLFANTDSSNALIGSSAAPQSFGPYSAATLGAINGAQVGSASLNPSLIGEDADDGEELGFRAALEYRGLDDGGFQLEGMMARDMGGSWQRGLGGMNAGADPTTIRVGAALPLDVPGGAGFALPFDQYFGISLQTDVDSLSAMFAPVGFYAGSIRFQPTIGFRYLRVDQELNFSGAGSGLVWTPQADGTPNPAAAPTVGTAPYQAALTSHAETNLYGPVIGLNASTTRQVLRLNALLRAGVLFGNEEIDVQGRGFGIPGTAGYNPLQPFSSSRDGSNATFMLESQLSIDVQILQLLNKLQGRNYGNSLVLRVGWSILWLDELAKADEAVRWDGFPATPTARRRSSEFTMDAFSLGLIFKY